MMKSFSEFSCRALFSLFLFTLLLACLVPLTFAEECHFDLPGDWNLDCRVDLEDFAVVAEHWLIDCNSLYDPACIPLDLDADGYDVLDDCDDNDPNTYPGAVELCDGKDNNCDDLIDNSNDMCNDGLSCTTDTCGPSGCENIVLSGWCAIEGQCYSDGEVSPASLCQECNAALDPLGWSNLPDSTPCGTGYECLAGECISIGIEVCNGIDDDGDDLIDEDFYYDDPIQGSLSVGDTCGTGQCEGGIVVCFDSMTAVCSTLEQSTDEVCDGIDNDCDGLIDEDLMGPLCSQQTGVCNGSQQICGGQAGWLPCDEQTYSAWNPNYEVVEVTCDGLDNDCDAEYDEDYAGGGDACDGPDSDLCAEGITACIGGQLICSDNTGSDLDYCDGLDNDCDPASPDGSEDPLIGAACDGPDSDLCHEGVYNSCVGGSLICSDTTDDLLDLCDGLDNDCDPSSPDGLEDPLYGTACDGPDSDLCLEGTYSCQGGTMACSDNTANDVEICDGLDNDCDGPIDEELTSPLCAIQQGVCSGAQQTCGGEQGWEICDEQTYSQWSPDYEMIETSCNDFLDNDCDGLMDCEDDDCASVCLLELSMPCEVGSECISGFCADGVCCESACMGTCQACIAELTGGADGTCEPVMAGMDPDDECPGGDCDGTGQCTE